MGDGGCRGEMGEGDEELQTSHVHTHRDEIAETAPCMILGHFCLCRSVQATSTQHQSEHDSPLAVNFYGIHYLLEGNQGNIGFILRYLQ